PGTDVLTDVTAVDTRSDRRLQLVWDAASQFDRQIRNASVRIEDAGGADRLRWTRLETQRAGAAAIERRRVDVEPQAAENHSEKDPRAQLGMNDTGVLADPADAGVLGVHAFLHWTRVDVRARVERLVARLAHPREQCVEPRADDVVVIVAPCISRDLRLR